MECNYMSFFKLLSDKPEDFENDEQSIFPDIQEEDFPDSYDIRPGTTNDCLELILDTGEQFCVPLEWLIAAARYHRFSSDTTHSGCMH